MTEYKRIYILKLVTAFVNVNGREPVLNPGPLPLRVFHYTRSANNYYFTKIGAIKKWHKTIESDIIKNKNMKHK
jgi:hypothetical protein